MNNVRAQIHYCLWSLIEEQGPLRTEYDRRELNAHPNSDPCVLHGRGVDTTACEPRKIQEGCAAHRFLSFL